MQYEPASPDGLSPFALVHVEAVQRQFSVQVVHAFPDECTLIKTNSLIEPRKG